MPKKSLRKKLGRVTVFSKVGLAMAGSILLQSAPASAGNPDFPGGRGAAFRDFKQANDGLSGKQLNQLFKVHWADMRNSAQAVAQPVFEQNANNLSHGPNVVNTNLNNLQNLSNLPNQVGATKQELNQQFKLERQAQKLEHQALKQELREAKQNFNTVQQISADRFIRGNGGFSLDLSSAVENITLGDKLFQSESSITISIGGESKTLSAGSKVTAAEYIAAKQVLATGGQKVGLDANGRAVSGSIDLNELTPGDKTMKVRDFIVPENVSAAGDFSKNGDIRITGDLINSGTIQAFSSDNKITTATISADNITNNSNASISSELNQSARDLGGVVSNLGLNLRADDVLSNYGSITSSGDLTLSAGKTLTNSGNAIAQNNLSLQAPKIVNSGRVESIAANVNLDSSSLSALSVNNYGGSITALDGAINIRSSEYQDRFDTLVSGGDLLSKELNVYTGGGTSNVFVNDLTGIVNTNGTAAHVSANTADLVIGRQCLFGDPTYYNTGNIILGGDITVGEDLAIIAGGDITTNQSSLHILARDSQTGRGCNITMVAGANVLTGSGEISPPGGPAVLPSQSNGSISQNANGSVSFDGASASGGSIILNTVSQNSEINSSCGLLDMDGGTITLAAFSNTSGNNGAILLGNNWSINTAATGIGVSGKVSIIAGAATGTAIDLGRVSTLSGGPATDILIVAAQPAFSSGSSITFDTSGRIISGNEIVASSSTNNADIVLGSVAASGSLSISTLGTVRVVESEFSGGIWASNDVRIKASAIHLVNGPGVQGNRIFFESPAGMDLDFQQSGTFTSSLGTFVTANGGDLNISGFGNYFGNVFFIADGAGQSINATGSQSSASRGYCISSNINDGTFNGNWTFVSPVTYANSSDSVVLSGSLTFAGKDFAIISSGDIDLTGANINLDGATNGGSLSLYSGFDFSPSTTGTVMNGGPYIDFRPSASGGSIIGAATVTTRGNNGNGGSVTAIACNGSITLGDIDTSGTNNGGFVNLTATESIQVGNITATGSVRAGSVYLETASPENTMGFAVAGVSIGAVGFGPSTNGTINVGTITTGNEYISLRTGLAGSINVSGNLLGQQIALRTGSLHFSGTQDLSAQQQINGGGGHISIEVSSLTTSVGSGTMYLRTRGLAGGFGGDIGFVYHSTSPVTVGNSGQFAFDVTPGDTSGGGRLVATFDGDVILNNGAFAANSVGGSGVLALTSNGSITVNSGAINLQHSDGIGADINLKAGQDGTGALMLNDTSFLASANATGASSNGGAIELIAPKIQYSSTTVTPLSLSAKGTGQGNGGKVTYVSSDTTHTFVGPAIGKAPKQSANYLEIDTRSGDGGGNGGSITVSVGGNLSINTSGLQAKSNGAFFNWNGAHYSLNAGRTTTGALVINGDIDANAIDDGIAGSIELSSRSSTAFSLYSSSIPKNGITGKLSAINYSFSSGSIQVVNDQGGINVVKSSGQDNAVLAYTVSLQAGGRGAISGSSSAVIIANHQLTLSAVTGAIGGNRVLNVQAPILSANTLGLINLQNQSFFSTVLEDSIAGGGLKLVTRAPVTVNDITTTKGSITIISSATNGGILKVSDGATLAARDGAVTLQNMDTANGGVVIGNNATVKTLGKGKVVSLVVGSTVPKVGTNPYPTNIAPSGVIASATPRNVIYFGNPGVVTVPNGTATVNAKNVNVLFSGTAAGQIKLGNGAFIEADPPSSAASQSVSSLMPTLESGTPTNLSISSSPAVEGIPFVNESSLQYPSQLQNMSLLTASSLSSLVAETLSLQSGLTRSDIGMYSGDSFDDDSYVVGSCNTSNEIDAAVRSDAIVLSSGEIFGGSISQSSRYASSELTETLSSKDGPVLFVPTKDTAIETPFGIVKISGNSIALVSVSSAGLSVFDLDDQHKGSVSVESNGHNVVLSPGRHVMITPHHTAEFAQLNPIETIAHRALSSSVKNGHRAHLSEFSVLSAFDSVKPLKALAASSHPTARKISGRMMKTTAILMQLGGAREQYQHYFRPHMTAMQK